MRKDQKVTAMVPLDESTKDQYLIMLTKDGWIKRVRLDDFGRNGAFSKMKPGMIAMKLVSSANLAFLTKHLHFLCD